MKTITYNPETHVLVPREQNGIFPELPKHAPIIHGIVCYDAFHMHQFAIRYMDSVIAAAPQPEPNHNWCAGCSPDNCSGCGTAPLAYITPQHDRVAELEAETTKLKLDLLTSYGEAEELSGKVAELEAALKVARDGIDKFLVANNSTEFDCACDLSVGYLCGPCHADMQQEPLKIALAKINEVLK